MKWFGKPVLAALLGFSIPSFAQVVMDTDDNAAVLTGTWTQETSTLGFYGDGYAVAQGGGSSDTVRFFSKKPISTTGTWCVQARWTAFSNRAQAATYQVYDGAGLRGAFTVNQQQNGGAWQVLGCVKLTAGRTSEVRLSDSGVPVDAVVVADAVRWVWDEGSLSRDYQDYCIAVNGGFGVAGGTTFVGKGFVAPPKGTCRPWSGIMQTATTVVGTSIGTACLSTDGKLFTVALQTSAPEYLGPGIVASDHIELCPVAATLGCPAHAGQSDQGYFAGPAAHVTCSPAIVPIPSSHD
jgi:hypothetical protein